MSEYQLHIVGTEGQVNMLSSHLGGVSGMFSVNSMSLEELCSNSDEYDDHSVFAVFDYSVQDDLGESANEGAEEVERTAEEQEEFFTNLKKISVLRNHPFLIVTHQEDIEYISQCHDVGAYDVVPDNLIPQEISFRLLTAIHTFERESKLKEQLQNAQKVAFDAMEDSSELGRVMQFLTRSNDCFNFTDLSTAIFESYEKLHVHGSIMIFFDKEEYYFSDDSKVRPIEMRLMKAIREKYVTEMSRGIPSNRFLSHQRRIVAVGSCCAMLVRDVIEEKQGRMRDIFAGIVTGLDARAHYVIGQQKEKRRQELLKNLFGVVKNTVWEFQELYDNNEEHTISVMDDFMLTLNSGLSVLGLSEDQEKYFVVAAEDAMNSLVAQYTNQMRLRGHLETILEQMQNLSKAL